MYNRSATNIRYLCIVNLLKKGIANVKMNRNNKLPLINMLRKSKKMIRWKMKWRMERLQVKRILWQGKVTILGWYFS